MPDATIIYTREDHVARLTLNRPEVGNAVNQQLAQELEDACHDVSRDDDIYIVVITGAGDRAFCSGSELESSVSTAIAMALSCDIRLASNRARFGFPQVGEGLIPTDGGTQRLPRIVGRAKAMELILTAETISAEEAFAIGLVSKVVAPENLVSEVNAVAGAIVTKGPIALRYAKEAVNKGLDLTLEQGLHLEADLYLLLHTTADRTEGIKAFLEKRLPGFKGQ
jgi:enoyl-CoA hydratase